MLNVEDQEMEEKVKEAIDGNIAEGNNGERSTIERDVSNRPKSKYKKKLQLSFTQIVIRTT